MENERQLLFAVLALQLEFIDPVQMADVCAAWAARRDQSVAALLRERGWLSEGDQGEVERLLDRRLRKHRGDARAGLRASIDQGACEVILGADDPVLRGLLDGLASTDPPGEKPGGPTTDPAPASIASTIEHVPRPSRFQAIAFHAAGGLGLVWRSRDNELNREVALKRLKPERRGHAEALGQFSREAQITGQLQHPNIVPVYDLGRDPVERDPFYIMKFVHGRTLREAIEDLHRSAGDGRPDPARRRRLLGALVQVGQAMAYAHARGVLHLDLKPDNIVLGAFGEVIVLDWGLARLSRGEIGDDGPADPHAPTVDAIVLSGEALAPGTTAGRVQGTREYMAPEQAEGASERIDERTDVFGLGGILFEVLTGRSPREFGGEPLGVALERIRTESIRRPRAVVDRLPAALDDLCARAMALDPSLRVPGAAAFVAELETWLADEPLIACREIVAGFEKMAGAHPDVFDYREHLARSRANLGLVLDGLGRHLEAEAAYRAAIAEYEVIVAARPLLPGPRADLAATRTHLGRALVALGRREEAEASRRSALEDYTALAAAHPPAGDYTTGLASVYLTMSLGPPAAARESPDPGEPDPLSVPTEETTGHPVAPASPGTTETGAVLPQLEHRGRIEILQRHAQGGLLTVYIARDHDLQRDVAVKILRTALEGSSARRRFLHEARIAARLEHPNIIPIHGLGFRSQDGVPFLMMRFVRGRTLTDAIHEYHRRRGPNGRHTAQLDRLLKWLIQACNALGFAHAQGIIHRDVKPENIMIGPSGEALLVDWGLAKVIARPGTGAQEGDATGSPESEEEPSGGSIVGTPVYMAPEQARGREDQIDARTDIYVMGASLFEVLTGRPPFQAEWGGGVARVLEAIVAGPAPRARAIDRAVPVELDAICARAMAREPADRYATAAEFERDLEGWLFGGPIAAFPESRLRRAWRRLRHDVR